MVASRLPDDSLGDVGIGLFSPSVNKQTRRAFSSCLFILHTGHLKAEFPLEYTNKR